MKYLVFIFSGIFYFNISSQDLARQLQKQMWYVKVIFTGESLLPFTTRNLQIAPGM
jgi:hypothetical protein